MLKKIKDKKSGVPVQVKSAAAYTISTLFSRGLAIITVPIFTRLMTTAEIGTVNIYNSWYSLISAIATLSLTSGSFSVALKDYADKRDEYMSSVLSLTSLVAVAISIIYFIKPSFWNDLLGLPTELVGLMLVGLIFAPARDFWLARERYEYRYKLSGTVMILSAVLATVASVWVVIQLNSIGSEHVAEGRLYANYIIIYGVATVIWIHIMLKGKTLYDKTFWKTSLVMSIPLVGYQVAAQILSVSDRMMIDAMIGKSAVGIYSTLYSVSSISLLFWNALNTSFIPYLFQNIEKEESQIKSISSSLLALYAVIAILMTFFAPEIVRILATEEYYEAIYIMPPIATGIFLTSVAHMYSNILVYYKQTKYVMYASFIAAAVNLILNYIFIRIYGYMAAAYTTLVSYVLLVVFEVYWANKVSKSKNNYPIYEGKRIFVMSTITMVVSMSSLLFYGNVIIRYVSIGAITLIGILLLKKYFEEKNN